LTGLWYLLGSRSAGAEVTLPQQTPVDPPTSPAMR